LERSASTKISVRALVVLGVVAVVVYAIDQVAKFLVVTHLTERVPVPILGDLLTFQFVRNPGAAFSIGSGSTWIFSIIATGVLIFVIWYARRIHSIGWAVLFGLLLGGLLGNLSDRLTRPPGFGVGAVVDFIQIPLLPAIFNLADVAIVSSMALFLILTVRGVGLNGPATADEPVADGRAAEEPAPDDAGADDRPATER
jgi:signal peptidase II